VWTFAVLFWLSGGMIEIANTAVQGKDWRYWALQEFLLQPEKHFLLFAFPGIKR
jgi:hypothetical protein